MVNISPSPTRKPLTTTRPQTQASNLRQVDQDSQDRARQLPRAAINNAPTKHLNAISSNTEAAPNTNQHTQPSEFLDKCADKDPFLITKHTDEKVYIEQLKSQANSDLSKVKNIFGQSLLNQAITSNKNQIVSYLLEYVKFELNQINLRLTPLIAAAYCDNLDACKQLIQAGATINLKQITEEQTYTAITKALQNQDENNVCANYLINALSESEKQEVIDRELRVAATQGDLNNVKFLLNNHQADLFSRSPDYDLAISNASSNHHHDVVEFLLEQTIQQLNQINESEGNQTKNEKTADIAGALIRTGTLPDLINFIEKVQLNVNQHDSDKDNLLHMAAGWSRLEIVKYLVEQKNASVSLLCKSQSAATWAAEEGHTEVMDYLLNQSGFRARHEQAQECFIAAAKGGKNATLKHLMANYPVEINGTNKKHFTALYLACRNNQFDTVKFLVENNAATLRFSDWRTKAPIKTAAACGNAEIVDYLINSTTSQCQRVEIIEKAFVSSIYSDRVEFVKSLYEKYRGIIEASEDYTVARALFLASERGQLDIIKYLVSQNADIDEELDETMVIEHSVDRNQFHIVKYLLTQYSGESRKETARDLAFRAISKQNTVTPLFEHLVLNEGIKLNHDANDSYRLTLFDKAVKFGRLDHINFLIKNGSEITLKRLRKCKNIEVFKFILKNIPPKNVAKIGRPTALSDKATQEKILTWMILRAGANNISREQTSMHESINDDYDYNSPSSSDESEYGCKTKYVPAALIAGRSQTLLESLEEAVISADPHSFNVALSQIEKSDYSEDILNFGYYSLNRAAYISLTRTVVNQDIILNLIAMGANPKEILETENDLKRNTGQSISESAHQFLKEIDDRSHYENRDALTNKIKESYQSHFAATLNHKRPADIMSTMNSAKKARLSEED